MAKLDFSGAGEFVPVPEGRYGAELTRSAEGLSDRAGKKKWAMQLTVTQDPQHGGEFEGKTIRWDISLQKQALWKVKQTLQALGEDIEEGEEAFDFDASLYAGRQATMVVGMQRDATYGERTRVLRLLPIGAMEAEE